MSVRRTKNTYVMKTLTRSAQDKQKKVQQHTFQVKESKRTVPSPPHRPLPHVDEIPFLMRADCVGESCPVLFGEVEDCP